MRNCYWSITAAFVGLAFFHSADPVSGQDQNKEKRFAMEFKEAPWRQVFEWYADQTGLPYASRWAAPAGTFSHTSPKGTTYTLHEVTTIINDNLLKSGYVLVPRPKSTTLLKIEK